MNLYLVSSPQTCNNNNNDDDDDDNKEEKEEEDGKIRVYHKVPNII